MNYANNFCPNSSDSEGSETDEWDKLGLHQLMPEPSGTGTSVRMLNYNSYCFKIDLQSEMYLHLHWMSVLVLAGIELIFFIVAGMGLCSGFVLETVLITQGYFPYC